MNLYRVKDGGNHEYYIVAPDPTAAEQAMIETLTRAEYGFGATRYASQIE